MISDVDVVSMNEQDFVDGTTADGSLCSDGSILLVVLGVECRKV